MGSNTGMKVVLTLRKYIDGQPTNETKINASNDPDYIAPYLDTVSCPVNEPTPTTTTTTTTAAPGTTTTTTQAQCYTYYVQNRNQTGGPNIYYTYIDCNGTLQGEFVVPGDSETREFCAKPNSIVINGSGGGYLEVAQTCIVEGITTTTTTAAPTTTTTTLSTQCSTYYVENYHQFDNMYILYDDCNGTTIGPITIPPDRATPDFCARVNTVRIQGSNTAGDIVLSDPNCTA
jgi:hypothetical protein